MLTIHHAAHTPPYAVKNGKRIELHGPPAPMRGIYEATYGDKATLSISDCPLVAAALAIRKACGERFVPFAQMGGTQCG